MAAAVEPHAQVVEVKTESGLHFPLALSQRVPFIQYVVCLAVVAALEAAFAHRLGAFASPSDFPFRIKWPNDIYARLDDMDMKVGGILCQSLATRGRFDVVIGLGLNVDNDEPTTSVNRVLRRAAEEKGRGIYSVTRGELLARTLNHLEEFISVIETEGFAPLEGTYRRYWLHEGQRLQVHEDLAGGGDVEMKICGLSENGYLKGMTDEGAEFELHPDGTSLDMMHGLVKRKL